MTNPQQVTYLPRVRPLTSRMLTGDLACLGAVVSYCAGVSPARIERWYERHSALYVRTEIPYRIAWEHDVWLFAGKVPSARLTQFLTHGIPAVVKVRAHPIYETGEIPLLVTGYDASKGELLCWENGQTPVVRSIASIVSMSGGAGLDAWLALPPSFAALPLNAAELMQRALYHEHKGDLQKALADYTAALATSDRSGDILFRRAIVLQRLGRITEAEEDYRAAIGALPESPQPYNNLAMLLADIPGRAEEAVALARNALYLEPANPRILDTLGYALYRAGRYAEARDVLERARGRALNLPRAAQAEIAVHLIRVHMANGDILLAKQVLRDALQLDPAAVPKDLKSLLE